MVLGARTESEVLEGTCFAIQASPPGTPAGHLCFYTYRREASTPTLAEHSTFFSLSSGELRFLAARVATVAGDVEVLPSR